MNGEDLDGKVNNSSAGEDSTPLNSLAAKTTALALLGLVPLALLGQGMPKKTTGKEIKPEEEKPGREYCSEVGYDPKSKLIGGGSNEQPWGNPPLEQFIKYDPRPLQKIIPLMQSGGVGDELREIYDRTGGVPSAQTIQRYAASIRGNTPEKESPWGSIIPTDFGKIIEVPSQLLPLDLVKEIRVFSALSLLPGMNTGETIGAGKGVLGDYLLSQVDYSPLLLKRYGEEAGISQDSSGRYRLRQPEESGVNVPGVFISKGNALKMLLQEFNKSNPYFKI